MKFKMMQVYVFVMLALFPSLALAAVEVVQQNWWQALLSWVLPIFGGVLTAVLTALGVQLLRKWGIEMKPMTLDDVITKAVQFGEGKALAALNAGQPKTAGAQKMELALGVVNTLINQFKLIPMAREAAVGLIEAKLGEQKEEERKNLVRLAAPLAEVDPDKPSIVIPTWATDG